MKLTNVSDLLTKKTFYDDPQIELYYQKRGIVKRKKETAFFFGSFGFAKIFARLHDKGRILIFYEDCPPTPRSLPYKVIFIQDISRLDESNLDKSGSFILFFKEEQMELKVDDYDDLQDWIKAINFFRDLYKREKHVTFDEIDSKISLMCASDNELADWKNIKQNYDYTDFLRDKGLLEMIEKLPLPIFSNRILIAKVKENMQVFPRKEMNEPETMNEKIDSSEKRQSHLLYRNSQNMKSERPSALTGQLQSVQNSLFDTKPINFEMIQNVLPANSDMTDSTTCYVFLISQRPLSEIDEEQKRKDHKTIFKDVLPAFVDFNCLYFVFYESQGDKRPPHKYISLQ